MNKQKIKGLWNEAVGETKERVGRAIGNTKMEAKGHFQEMKGKGQKALGEIKDAAKKTKNDTASDIQDLNDSRNY